MSGWVYIVTNEAIPGLVKVGYTTRSDLKLRLREFNRAELPYPYEKAYALWVEEPRLIEQRVHQALAGHRENKEWFRCSVEHAKETIEQIAGPESVKAMALRAAEEEQLRSQAIEAANREHQRLMEEAKSRAERAEKAARHDRAPLPLAGSRGAMEQANAGGSEDLLPKPGWKLLEEIEGRPYRKIRRKEDRLDRAAETRARKRKLSRREIKEKDDLLWGCLIPFCVIMSMFAFGAC